MQAFTSWFDQGSREEEKIAQPPPRTRARDAAEPPPHRSLSSKGKGSHEEGEDGAVALREQKQLNQASVRNPSESFGVGIVFEVNPRDGCVRIVDIDAMCSAGRAGVILVNDEVLKVGSDIVEKRPMHLCRELILGKQGTYVSLTFRRTSSGTPYVYEVDLMRGGAEYIEIAAQCKAMAAEQSKLVGKMRDLSEIVAAQREELADFRRAGSSDKGGHDRAQLEQALIQAEDKAQAMQRAFNELHCELDEMRRDGSAQQVERLRAENAELAAGLGLLIKSKEEAQNRLKSIKGEGMDASRRISLLERERDSAERTCEDLREELSLAREVIAKAKAGGSGVDPASRGARGGGGGEVGAELMERLEESEKRAAQLESSAKTAAGAHAMRVEELQGSIASLEASLEGAHERAKTDKRALQDALAELDGLRRRVSSRAEGEDAMSSGASSPMGIPTGFGGDLASSLSLPDDVASLQRSLRTAIDGRNDAEKRFERAREEALKWSRLVSGRQDHAVEYEGEMQRNMVLEEENGKLEARLKQATERLGRLERESVSRELVEEERAKNSRLEALLDQVNGDLALEVKGWRNKLEDEMERRAEVEEMLQHAVGEAEKARKVADEALAREESSAPREGVDVASRMSEADLGERARVEREIVELRAKIEALEEEKEQAAAKWEALAELMKKREEEMEKEKEAWMSGDGKKNDQVEALRLEQEGREAELRGCLGEARGSLDVERGRRVALEGERNRLRDEVRSLRARISDAEGTPSKAGGRTAETITELREKLMSLTEEMRAKRLQGAAREEHFADQVRSVEAQKAALAHRVEFLTSHVDSLNKELQTMTSRCVSLEQGRHGEGGGRGGEEDEVSRLRGELETFKEACRHSVPLSEFDAFKAAAELAQERLKTTAQESAEREAAKYAENVEILRRACKEEERACRADRDAIVAQCEARAELERESHSALVSALEGEIGTLRESKKACARCAGSDQSLSAEKQRREAVEEELSAANERCQRVMSDMEEVRAAAAVAEEEAASERGRSEEKMAELFAKLEDAEAGLKSAKAEANKAKERLKEAQRELSALRAKAGTDGSAADTAQKELEAERKAKQALMSRVNELTMAVQLVRSGAIGEADPRDAASTMRRVVQGPGKEDKQSSVQKDVMEVYRALSTRKDSQQAVPCTPQAVGVEPSSAKKQHQAKGARGSSNRDASSPASKAVALLKGQAQWEDAPSKDQGLSHNLSKPTESARENTMVAKVSLLKNLFESIPSSKSSTNPVLDFQQPHNSPRGSPELITENLDGAERNVSMMTTQEMEARVRMELSRLASASPSPADRFDLNSGGPGSAGQSPQARQTIIDRFADISSPPQPADSPQFLSPEEKALVSDLQVTTSPQTVSNSIAKSLEHALSHGAPIEDLQDFNAEAQGALSRLAESDFRIMTHGDPLEGNIKPIREILSKSPGKGCILKGASQRRGKRIGFDNSRNIVCSFTPDFIRRQQEGIVDDEADAPQTRKSSSSLSKEDEKEIEDDPETEAKLRANTRENAGSSYSFC